jgi:hypothetical protein
MIIAAAGLHMNRRDIRKRKRTISRIIAHHQLPIGNEKTDVVVAIGAGDQECAIWLKLGRKKRPLFQSLEHNSLSRCDTVLRRRRFPHATVACSEPSSKVEDKTCGRDWGIGIFREFFQIGRAQPQFCRAKSDSL